MKKMNLLILLVAILLFFLIPNMSNIKEQINLKYEKTPEGFDEYQHITDLVNNTEYDVQVIEGSSIAFGEIQEDSIIWLVKRQGNPKDKTSNVDTEIFYKIDNKGIIIDSLTFTNEFINHVDNYLINMKSSYYSTWLKDGSIEKKQFISIKNKSLVFTNELKSYLKDAEYIAYDYETDPKTNKRFKKVVFYKNNVWSQIFTESEEYTGSMTFSSTNNLYFSNLDDIFSFTCYKKKIWNGHSFPDFGLYLNGKDGEHWRGTSCYDLKIKNKNIKLKEVYAKLYKGSNTPQCRLSVYKNPDDNYILIKEGDSSIGDESLYLIRL